MEESGLPPKKPLRRRHTPGENVDHAEDPSKAWLGIFCICGRKFKCVSSLSIHLRQFTEKGKFECAFCKEHFFVLKLLQNHYHSNHNAEQAKSPKQGCCIECGKAFPTVECFRKHRSLDHSSPKAQSRPVRLVTLGPVALHSDDSNDSDIQFIGSFNKGPSSLTKELISTWSYDEAPLQSSPSPNIPDALATPNGSASQPQPSTSKASFTTTTAPIPIKKGRRRPNLQVTKPKRQLPLSRVNSSRTTAVKLFACALCQIPFSRVCQLRRHLKIIHEVGPANFFPIACPFCPETDPRSEQIISHCLTVHNVPSSINRKGHLPLASSSRDSIAVPLVTLDEEEDDNEDLYDNKPPLSPEVASSSPEDMNDPLDTLVDPHQPDATQKGEGFYCTCGEKFPNRKRLETHLLHEQEQEREIFQCNWCNKLFPSQPLLKSHAKKVHKMYIVNCGENGEQVGCVCCVKRFEKICDLQRHQQNEHNLKVNVTKLRKVYRPRVVKSGILTENCVHGQVASKKGAGFKCSCGKNYKRKASLLKHIREKLWGKCFKCCYCPKAFSNKHYLKVHMEKCSQKG